MRTSDFAYQLPEELIAHYPPAKRGESRLLHLNRASGAVSHLKFADFAALLKPHDLLVFNNTRVIPARLFGQKETGGRIEVLLERIKGQDRVLAQVKASKSPAIGSTLWFTAGHEVQASDNGRVKAQVLGRQDAFYELQFELEEPLLRFLERTGHIPLPPYIKRPDEREDRERYQTVFSRIPGAVAAPTAGLHFDQAMLTALKQAGIEQQFITLHVGAGTFQPVRVDNVTEHQMHSEWIEVAQPVVEAVTRCRRQGGRVIAVGTTTVRSLETAASGGTLAPYQGETDIFIYPGFEFQVVDAILTNFHLPESTLLMLISAFAGKEKVLDAYAEAVRQRYRFFSYGDAMFVA